MKARLSICVVCASAALTLAACSPSPPDGSASSSGTGSPTTVAATAPVIPAPPSAPAAADSAALPSDHTTTQHLKIAIHIPALPAGEAPLASALRNTADDAKRQFLQALPDPKQRSRLAGRQFQLLLDFKVVANTASFTSVRETGMEATGGAHPIPIQAAFVYDRRANKLITLNDLFKDSDAARRALANFAHDTLLKKFTANAPKPGEGSTAAIREWKTNMVQMLDDGTKPTTVNYSLFVVRAGATQGTPSPGLTLIFPPYQVAPYVYGTQLVEVPASLFARFLKPGYASDFVAP